MKRRNADCGKLRRPIKRNKITEGMYGSTTVLYMKFLILWAIVITADFMFMFRFEFLWPFWLLLRSVHDSFKYKGLAFSVLFVCIAITSDLVCLFFIPVHWLLFAASTYVWVQYVWHTDKGICLPTIILWMLFVYLEAGIRWKDSRHMPHLDLCRPFAAHCIGYPVVTLGFGFKSYVGYRMRQRKQREVAKENEFYMQLLQHALPQEEAAEEALITVANAGSSTSSSIAQNTVATSCSPSSLATATISSMIAAVTSSACSPSGASSTANGTAGGSGGATLNHQHHNDHHSNSHSSSCSSSNSSSTTTASLATLSSMSATASLALSSSNGSAGDDKSCIQLGVAALGGGGSAATTANGHVAAGGGGGSNKNNRRSVDKENKHRAGAADRNAAASSSYAEQDVGSNINNNSSSSSSNNKHSKHNSSSSNNNNNYQQLQHAESNGKDAESGNYQVHQQQQHSAMDKNYADNSNSKRQNGNVLQYDADDVVAVEPVEKSKGRRNRSKKDNNSSKDNHNHHNNNSHNTSNNNNCSSSNHKQKDGSHSSNSSSSNANSSSHQNNNHNSDASSVSSSTSSASTSSSSTGTTISNLANKVVSKICESCLKFEADIKKYRTEISHMKQIENELRQKLETNLTTKSCLLAKQKECDELEKRIQELTNARHADMLQLQTAERRLTEERRQKQSLDSLLSNEKKARKLAEEKAARPECSAQCRQRKQQIEEDIKQLRRDLKAAEEAKQQAEQIGCKYEQELRMFEAEIRNRDSNLPGTEMLMNALAAMQDKNSTLEKNLSAETRVKLDLFSALGDAKRQLEIAENRRRSKEEEVLDLKAKIAQLLAVMPTDSLCLPACSSTGASSMLRMNDTPPLGNAGGPGPSSPMLNSLGVSAAQQQQQQLSLGVPVSMAGSVMVSVANSSSGSNLDPNASIYTPKTVGGSGVVVGGNQDA